MAPPRNKPPARKRAPSTPKRAGAATESGARELRVDPGPAPRLAGDPPDPELDADHVLDDREPEPPPAIAAAVDALAEFELETVEMLLGFLLLVFHWTLGRGGPPDAYVADDVELRQMARPATRVLNRSARARALARHGDGLAFAMTFGGFVVKETEEVARWRAGDEHTGAVDQDVAGLGVQDVAGENVQGGVRRWRPTVPPPEA